MKLWRYTIRSLVLFESCQIRYYLKKTFESDSVKNTTADKDFPTHRNPLGLLHASHVNKLRILYLTFLNAVYL